MLMAKIEIRKQIQGGTDYHIKIEGYPLYILKVICELSKIDLIAYDAREWNDDDEGHG